VTLPEDSDFTGAFVRFRPASDSPRDEYDREWVSSGHVAWRQPASIRGRRLCFQAGLSLSPKSVLFEPWTCLPVSAAALWEPPPPVDPAPPHADDEAVDAGSEVE
jgi:hypothetical protein